MNLFIQLFLNVMTENFPQKDEPFKVLAILNEFCTLGRLNNLKNGFGFLAGYNIHLMAMSIIQNIGQFYELYDGRDNCDVFFQNTDYKICYRQNTKTDQELSLINWKRVLMKITVKVTLVVLLLIKLQV